MVVSSFSCAKGSRPACLSLLTFTVRSVAPSKRERASTAAQSRTAHPLKQRSASLGARATRHHAAADLTEQQAEYLEVGTIITTHGVRGELKIQALTDFPEERLTQPGTRWLQAGKSESVREVHLEHGRSMVSKGREIWLVKLRGIDNLNESTMLRGQTLLVRHSDKLELEDEDEFLVQDLIGSKVLLQENGSSIGEVIDVYDGAGPGAHDLLCIAVSDSIGPVSAQSNQSQAHNMLLPFVKDFVPVVDHDQKVIQIVPPAGLLELALTPPKQSPKSTRRKARGKPVNASGASKL